MKVISREELQLRTSGPDAPILVEALPSRYFSEGHLPRALNINFDEIRERAGALLPDRTAPIVVYCASPTCTNSDKAAVQLRALGYSDVSVYKGGKADWQAAGLPLERH